MFRCIYKDSSFLMSKRRRIEEEAREEEEEDDDDGEERDDDLGEEGGTMTSPTWEGPSPHLIILSGEWSGWSRT